MDRLYNVAEEKANAVHISVKKEIARIDKELAEVDKRFDKLLSLHVDGAITASQFAQQNERIAQQQQDLANRKAELVIAMEEHQDFAEKFQAFKKEVERFSTLDIGDLQVMKSVLRRLIQKIEVFEGGKITIHYNLSTPQTKD